jgi:hypothetical protein
MADNATKLIVAPFLFILGSHSTHDFFISRMCLDLGFNQSLLLIFIFLPNKVDVRDIFYEET